MSCLGSFVSNVQTHALQFCCHIAYTYSCAGFVLQTTDVPARGAGSQSCVFSLGYERIAALFEIILWFPASSEAKGSWDRLDKRYKHCKPVELAPGSHLKVTLG